MSEKCQDVSIPLWFDSYVTEPDSFGATKLQSQFHYGSILIIHIL